MEAFHLSKPNPTYYAIITADVRYDNDLPPNAKLLFGEITALANATGVCTASNAYFAKLYDVKPTTVSEWVSMLFSKGYIDVTIKQSMGNKREIILPIAKIPKTYSEKAEDPSSGNPEDNNTSINNIPPTPNIDSDFEADLNKAYRLYLKYFIVSTVELPGNDMLPKQWNEHLMQAATKRYRFTPKRRTALERRFKDADAKMVFAAIVGYGKADWSNGNNDRGWKADLADFICRSYENIERGARLYEEQRKSPGGEDAWAKLH